MESAYLTLLILLLLTGMTLWLIGYRKMITIPYHDQLRGTHCLPGFFVTLSSIVLLAFLFHWIVGIIVIILIIHSFHSFLPPGSHYIVDAWSQSE
jgi:hypothetical protein